MYLLFAICGLNSQIDLLAGGESDDGLLAVRRISRCVADGLRLTGDVLRIHSAYFYIVYLFDRPLDLQLIGFRVDVKKILVQGFGLRGALEF